jgi:chromate reductase, NAD(P)H dehydrogenase (quinone)
MQSKILAFCGSSRHDSINQKLLNYAVSSAFDAGARVTQVRLLDFALPIYDGDLEADHGVPEGAQKLNELIASHQGLLIATPEHNGGYTALLKNAIDWASRSSGSAPGLGALAGKVAALLSASPSHLGGIRSQLALIFVLNKLSVHVIPESFALSVTNQTFDEHGRIRDVHVKEIVRNVAVALVRMTEKVSRGSEGREDYHVAI